MESDWAIDAALPTASTTTSAPPASWPVCDFAARAPAAVLPAFNTTTGFMSPAASPARINSTPFLMFSR